MKLIDISTPKFPNTFTMVDDADFDWLNQWKWHCNSNGYAIRVQQKDNKKRTIRMHLEILKTHSGMEGDHRFGNKLDNRRKNLRTCTHAENMKNRKPISGRTLPKGVHWRLDMKRFQARIQVNGRRISLGYFHTASEAEDIYNAAAAKYHGEFARPNSIVEINNTD